MKTDLRKILSISGESGLFLYVQQAKNGAIVESLTTKKRMCAGLSAKMSSMADIAIYTDDGEIKLAELFLKMKDVLGENPAPAKKADQKELVAFFEKALPAYDRDRFYVSHMRKVVEWYNVIKEFASLDFMTEEEMEEADKE